MPTNTNDNNYNYHTIVLELDGIHIMPHHASSHRGQGHTHKHTFILMFCTESIFRNRVHGFKTLQYNINLIYNHCYSVKRDK